MEALVLPSSTLTVLEITSQFQVKQMISILPSLAVNVSTNLFISRHFHFLINHVVILYLSICQYIYLFLYLSDWADARRRKDQKIKHSHNVLESSLFLDGRAHIFMVCFMIFEKEFFCLGR